jgi:membrane protease YdiL (CAAX protease family)
MSILGQADGGDAALATAIVLVVCCVAAVVGGTLGFYRKEAVLGPERVGGPQSGWPVLATLLFGTAAWVVPNIALAMYKKSQWASAGGVGEFKIDLRPADYAFVATVPGIIAAVVVFLTLKTFSRDVRPRLGLGARLLPSGIARGVGATLLVVPPVLVVSVLTEVLYKKLQYQHPSEHELLGAMKASAPAVRWMLVAGAVLVAPVAEELLFRGLFQTLLVWAFNNIARAKAAPATPGRLAAGRWLAILVTAAVFASIHAWWSAPPIFALAIGLGFAFERTGSLWVNMTMHALFNGFQTAIFLMSSGGSS